ncbi:MAG: DUF1698 domain-containing protein [Bryobacteraceae bacterium]|nr:DUF1698 domain-containing protein [Bryobacteraceae bacterium]
MQSRIDPLFHDLTQQQRERIEQGAWYHSIELPGGRLVNGLIPVDALRGRFDAFGIPAGLRGKRVLDIGAATGWCTFELERRGAQVVAVDCVEYEDFRVAHQLLNSRAEYLILDMEEMTPERLGRFDYVLFFGVLYHLRHPLLGLERVLALTTDTAFIESFVCDAHLPEPDRAANTAHLEFYETDELGGQIDNWFGPTANCLTALCRAAGFVRVEPRYIQDRRAGLVCHRSWNGDLQGFAPAPWVSAAVNNRTGQPVFDPAKDEYLCIYFKSDAPSLTRDTVRVELDSSGIPVLKVTDLGRAQWQANLKFPYGVPEGPHQIRLWTAGSTPGAGFPITVGAPQTGRAELDSTPPDLFQISNGTSPEPIFYGHRNEQLVCWFRHPGRSIVKEQLRARIGDEAAPELEIAFLTPHAQDWQCSLRLPADLPAGRHNVRLRTLASTWSNPLPLTRYRQP